MINWYLLETAVSKDSTLILLNCCEIEVKICPTVFWFPLESNWTIGFVVNEFGEFSKVFIKSEILDESGVTITEVRLNWVIQSNVSRI